MCVCVYICLYIYIFIYIIYTYNIYIIYVYNINHISNYLYYLLFDHLAVCITVIISAVACIFLIRRCILLLTRDIFLNHCLMKPSVVG